MMTLSQPVTVSYVYVGLTAGVDVYVFPYQVKLSHSTAVVSLVVEWLIVRWSVTVESQPLEASYVCVGATAGVDV